MARSWILDGSLLYVYIIGGGPCGTACAQARLIPRCKNENRMSLLQFVNVLIGSVLSQEMRKMIPMGKWSKKRKKEKLMRHNRQ